MSQHTSTTSPLPSITMVGNARDYHAMDWYHSVKSICRNRNVIFLTDLISSEGHLVIARPDDNIVFLANIDRFLLTRQGRLSDLWRNIVKLLLIPWQILALRKYYRRHVHSIYHAHTMYYMLLCAIANIPFIGTPQGSEILIRPTRSRMYRLASCYALRRARYITVDSEAMRSRIWSLSRRDSILLQNGVNVDDLQACRINKQHRTMVCSLRGMTPLYRIKEILVARTHSKTNVPITMFYPFWDEQYRKEVRALMTTEDADLGRLSHATMYATLAATRLAISIPSSDSSPRSVYEAIFAGCAVAVAPNPYVDALPPCMRARVLVIDISDPRWFDDALTFANKCLLEEYQPSEQAKTIFNQNLSAQRLVATLY